MSRQNAYEANYEIVLFLGKPALLANDRLDKSTVPEGLHCYELRHADDDWGEPCQLAKQIGVNFYGTLLTNEPIQLGSDGLLDLSAQDIQFDIDSSVSDIPAFLAAATHKYQYMLRCPVTTELNNNSWSICCYDKRTLAKQQKAPSQQSVSSPRRPSAQEREDGR